MKAALLQLNSVWEAPAENHGRAAELFARAAAAGCDIAVLPEMFACGTTTNTGLVAESADGPTHRFLSAAAQNYGLHIIAGVARQCGGAGGKARNCAVVYNRQGEVVALYAKMYPFSPAREQLYYEAGTAPVVFELAGASCVVFICYDLRFPEAFRSIAKSVQAIVVIANWPRLRIAQWDILLRARAIENQCYIIGVNRTGLDGNGLYYSGSSQIVDPRGKVLCRGSDRDAVVTGTLDPQEVDRYRAKYAFLDDMRPLPLA